MEKSNVAFNMIKRGTLLPLFLNFSGPLLWVLLIFASLHVQAESEPSPVAEVTLVLGISVVHQHDGYRGCSCSEVIQFTLGIASKLSQMGTCT